jgi:glucans biosynthesis protein C
MYFAMFTLGALFASRPNMWPRLIRWRWVALVAAVCSWAMLIGVRPAKPFEHLVVATMQWGAVVAAFGFAQIWLNRDHPLRQRLTEAVFPVYILHQTIIIVFSQLLLPLQWTPLIEGPVLIVLTFGLSYLGYEGVRRSGFLRPWFGVRAAGQVN